jgi:hypothetical protein
MYSWFPHRRPWRCARRRLSVSAGGGLRPSRRASCGWVSGLGAGPVGLDFGGGAKTPPRWLDEAASADAMPVIAPTASPLAVSGRVTTGRRAAGPGTRRRALPPGGGRCHLAAGVATWRRALPRGGGRCHAVARVATSGPRRHLALSGASSPGRLTGSSAASGQRACRHRGARRERRFPSDRFVWDACRGPTGPLAERAANATHRRCPVPAVTVVRCQARSAAVPVLRALGKEAGPCAVPRPVARRLRMLRHPRLRRRRWRDRSRSPVPARCRRHGWLGGHGPVWALAGSGSGRGCRSCGGGGRGSSGGGSSATLLWPRVPILRRWRSRIRGVGSGWGWWILSVPAVAVEPAMAVVAIAAVRVRAIWRRADALSTPRRTADRGGALGLGSQPSRSTVGRGVPQHRRAGRSGCAGSNLHCRVVRAGRLLVAAWACLCGGRCRRAAGGALTLVSWRSSRGGWPRADRGGVAGWLVMAPFSCFGFAFGRRSTWFWPCRPREGTTCAGPGRSVVCGGERALRDGREIEPEGGSGWSGPMPAGSRMR